MRNSLDQTQCSSCERYRAIMVLLVSLDQNCCYYGKGKSENSAKNLNKKWNLATGVVNNGEKLYRRNSSCLNMYITSLIQKHRSITLTWSCLCGEGLYFWRIKGVPFMRCISTHKWIWSRLPYASGAVCGVTKLKWYKRTNTTVLQKYTCIYFTKKI